MSQDNKADWFTLDIWIPAGCLGQPGFVYPNDTLYKGNTITPEYSNFLEVSGKLPYQEAETVNISDTGLREYKFTITVKSTKNIARPTEFDVFEDLPFAKELSKDSLLYIYSEFTNKTMTDRLFFRNNGSLKFNMTISEFANQYTLGYVEKSLLNEEYNNLKIKSEIYEPQLANLISSYSEISREDENYDTYEDSSRMHIQVEVFRIYSESKFVLVGRVFEIGGDYFKWDIYDMENFEYYGHTKIYKDIKRVEQIQEQLSYVEESNKSVGFNFINIGKYTIYNE